ncbi:MAG: pyridoxamine 5'-phosphate oxidase family protein [Acidobacteria bacterium]|nr:pyridoxamine 5'-phosphate oxidase family protein [Acidobacteriota bacterium]
MAKLHESVTPEFREWIAAQKLFFVASAPLGAEGHVNVSPKGHDCLRVLDERTVAYLDLTGSGNETSAHIAENGRITLMWCAFEGPPRILRLYGRGEVVLPGSQRWAELSPLFEMLPGARQIVVNHVERVQTSCGFAVPLLEYREERPTLQRFALSKGEDGMVEYRREKNQASIDGLPTPLAATFED